MKPLSLMLTKTLSWTGCACRRYVGCEGIGLDVKEYERVIKYKRIVNDVGIKRQDMTEWDGKCL